MRSARFFILGAIILICASGLLVSCKAKNERREVVAYVCVDQVYAEPVLKNFEKETGIKVLAVYDVEATKTSGLINRIIAERERPQADVFWNGEFAQTLLLKNEGLLQPYNSPSASDLPAQYRDKDGMWTAFGSRARVILVNKKLLKAEDYPESVYDLLNEKYPADKIALSQPVFGTSSTQAAAMYAAFGDAKARDFYQAVKSRGVRIVDGNSVVKDLVCSGQLIWGYTDSDDACVGLKEKCDVAVVYPDRRSFGTLVIPSTLALVKGAPHPEEARRLIDYLLAPQAEKELVSAGLWHPTGRSADADPGCFGKAEVAAMKVELSEVMEKMPQVRKDLKEIFVR